MDATNLCNALRMEFEGVFESKIPLDAFPAKIQDMILALARQENYSIEYMMASLFGGSINRYWQRCQYPYSWWMD